MKRDNWLKPTALAVLVTFFALISGCTQAAQEAKRKPIYDSKEVVKLPPKLVKKTWPKGTIKGITKDKPAPFSGILITEKRAKTIAELRIAYDHLYNVSSINSKFTLSVLKVADNKLAAADAEVKRLRKAQNSWWSKNRTWVLLLTGSVVTLVLGGFAIWGVSELKK